MFPNRHCSIIMAGRKLHQCPDNNTGIQRCKEQSGDTETRLLRYVGTCIWYKYVIIEHGIGGIRDSEVKIRVSRDGLRW